MIKEFKEFMLRGNVLDLAVGVVIGSAFTAIVTGVVEGLLTPLISLIFALILPNQDFENLTFRLNGQTFDIGQVITALITFLITAFVLFMVVKGVNKLRSLGKKEEEEAVDEVTAEDYLEEIRDLLKAQTGATDDTAKNELNSNKYNSL